MKWIEKIFEVAAIIFLALMTITVAIQVFTRFIGHPFIWSEELTNIFLIYGSFMGGALAYYKGKGFKITVLVDTFAPKMKKIVESIVTVISIALLTFVTYSVFLYINSTGSSETPILDIPHTLILISMPIGYILIIIRLIKDLKDTIVGSDQPIRDK